MKAFNVLALLLVIVGGINWGLVAVFDFNLVDFIFAPYSTTGTLVYVLVGLAALWSIGTLARMASGKPAAAPPARRFERMEAEEKRHETVPSSEPVGKR